VAVVGVAGGGLVLKRGRRGDVDEGIVLEKETVSCTVKIYDRNNSGQYYNYKTTITAKLPIARTGNTKGGSITALLTSCLTGLESAV
jgi:hypothetical protein